ncbi:AAA family ATPase [soil metagenome]
MDGKRLIEKIKLRNILSFGDKGEEIELQPLNIIIGQNASGKSNLVDVLKLLRLLPEDRGLISFISKNGGISEWIWKGKREDNSIQIEVSLSEVIYKLIFKEISQRIFIEDEEIKLSNSEELTENREKYLKFNEGDSPFKQALNPLLNNSILSRSTLGVPLLDIIQFYSPLIVAFSNFAIFTDLETNRSSNIRNSQPPDALNDFLEEDGSNLALVLNDLEHRGDTKDKIVENLKKFNPRIKDYSIRILGGTVQLFIREEGLEKPISAMRLSDGTLRYLCLLAILCHPEPPPLICIEEPETGLHPDILPTIAELMKEASQRTQLIVTTHSDILVSAFSDMPEAVLVCEKDEDGTHFKRLNAEKLKEWLDEYSLGDLWLKGEIGGTRW